MLQGQLLCSLGICMHTSVDLGKVQCIIIMTAGSVCFEEEGRNACDTPQ